MASRANKNHDDDASSTSSPIHSPYNLRRNHSQPGGVTKKNSFARSKHSTRDASVHTSSSRTSSTPSYAASSQPQHSTPLRNASSRSQRSASDDDEIIADNNATDIELSDDEPEAIATARKLERQENKLPPVKGYFEYVDENTYLCKKCTRPIKISNYSDANLRSHLGRAHHMELLLFPSQRIQAMSNLKSIKPEMKRELDQAAIDCIITDGRPFGDFRRCGMLKFLNKICFRYRGPGRKTVRRHLGISYHEHRQQLKNILNTTPWLAVTVDIWTKKKKSFICLTGHAFNYKYETIPLVLRFRQFKNSHTSENIKKHIRYEFQRLNIEDKVCAIVGDNGSDVKKALNELMPGKRFSCTAHLLNLVVKVGLGLWDKLKEKKSTQQLHTTSEVVNRNREDDELSSDSDYVGIPDELEDEEYDEDAQTNGYLSGSDDGSYDTGNYVNEDEDDGESDNNTDNEEQNDNDDQLIDLQNIRAQTRQLIDRIRDCISNINSTRAIIDYVQRQEKIHDPQIASALVTDIEIRWNITFTMLHRFIGHRSIIDDINRRPFKIPDISRNQQIKLGSKKFEFTNGDWSKIKNLSSVLCPFFSATTVTPGKKYPTSAAAYSG
ncbi:unnamed protein product [Adineta steineri]|uniref:BED-type domain-containing protein n=1 Tax=Adineta steineri TaxID=433720 RepID=A0A814QCD7_9BILA|nr:unnamed protein product [Adineta steineri]